MTMFGEGFSVTVSDLFDLHYSEVNVFLRGLSGSAAVADDLAQETFLRVLKISGPSNRIGKTYLMRVAYTCWSRYLKQRRPTVLLDSVRSPVFDLGPHETLEKAEDASAVRRCLAHMSADHRGILLLVSCMGYTFVEASEILGVPRTTLVSRHQKALEWLKNNLKLVTA